MSIYTHTLQETGGIGHRLARSIGSVAEQDRTGELALRGRSPGRPEGSPEVSPITITSHPPSHDPRTGSRPRRRRRRATLLLMAPALVAVGACTPSALAVRPPNPPIVVTNTNDSGAGSLRAAVAQANVVVGPDTITFAIPGLGGQVITPLSDLPAITERVTIDGYTQSGAARATETTLADLKVVIDAQNLSVGLDLQGNGSHIRGLVIHSAAVAGSTADAIRITGDANRVTGNYLGTGAAGLVPLLNDQGVQIDGDNNIVGGTGPAERNVIGADLDCVIVVGGSGNQILGNRIGTNAAGTAGLGGGAGFAISYGVMIEEFSGNVVSDNLISDMFVAVEV
jgi:hypothetical protein